MGAAVGKDQATHHLMTPSHVASSSSTTRFSGKEVCSYYQIGTLSQNKLFLRDLLRVIESLSVSRLFWHEHFTPVTRLVIDVDDAKDLNIDDLLVYLQPLVRDCFDLEGLNHEVGVLALVSKCVNSIYGDTKVGYHLVWPAVFVESSVAKKFIELALEKIPEIYASHVDSQIYSNRTLRMYFSDKAHENGDASHRPYVFYSFYDRLGRKLNQINLQVRDSPFISLHEVMLQLSTLRVFGVDPSAISGKLKDKISGEKTDFYNRTFWSAVRSRAPRFRERICLTTLDEFDAEKAMVEFEKGIEINDKIELLVRYMNNYFGKLNYEEKNFYVVKTAGIKYPVILKKNRVDFLGLLEQYSVVIETGKKPVQKKIGAIYVEHSLMKTYRTLTFNPTPIDCTETGAVLPLEDDLNLYEPTHMANRADCAQFAHVDFSVVKDHIYKVWACSNPDYFHYIISWLANILQYPWRKLRTSLAIRGLEGVGKSSVFQGFSRQFLGPYAVTIQRMADVTGRFNGLLRNKLLCVIEESQWSKNDIEQFKSWVTDDYITFETKGRDQIVTNNFINFIMITNKEYFLPAEANSRRWALFEADSKKMGQDYFAVLNHALNNREIMMAFGHYLFNYDISNFNAGVDIPFTGTLRDQRIASLPPVFGWWYDCLLSGQNIPTEDENFQKRPTDDQARDWVVEAGSMDFYHFFKASRPAEFTYSAFTRHFAQIHLKNSRHMTNNVRKTVYYVGTLAEARENFTRQFPGIRYFDDDHQTPKPVQDYSIINDPGALSRTFPLWTNENLIQLQGYLSAYVSSPQNTGTFNNGGGHVTPPPARTPSPPAFTPPPPSPISSPVNLSETSPDYFTRPLSQINLDNESIFNLEDYLNLDDSSEDGYLNRCIGGDTLGDEDLENDLATDDPSPKRRRTSNYFVDDQAIDDGNDGEFSD